MYIYTVFVPLLLFVELTTSSEKTKDNAMNDIHQQNSRPARDLDEDDSDDKFIVYLKSGSNTSSLQTYPGLIIAPGIAVVAKTVTDTNHMQICKQHDEECAPATKMMENNGFTFWKTDLLRSLPSQAGTHTIVKVDGVAECKSNGNNVELEKDKGTKDGTSFICRPICDDGAIILCNGKVLGVMVSPRNDDHGQIWDINSLVKLLPRKGGKEDGQEGEPQESVEDPNLKMRSSDEKNATSTAVVNFRSVTSVVSLLFHHFF
ncbi:hypothetical protein Trydic_g9262 [Trypoxylus dichotomus]